MIQQTQTNSNNNTCWAGLDVGKHNFQAALIRPGQRWPELSLRELPTRNFPRTLEGVEAFCAWLGEEGAGTEVRAVMEATGNYSEKLALMLYQYRPTLAPAIANARQTHAFIKSLGLRSKTDALDARALACYGAERRPAPFEPALPEYLALRHLVRHRQQLVKQQLALSNIQSEGTPDKFIARSRKLLLCALDREIAKAEKRMHAHIAQSPELNADCALLCSIYGVAFLTASSILAELGDLRKFARARQLAAFTGLSPRQYQSGSSIDRPAHLCKHGNGRVRKALYMAALTAIRDEGPMQRCYERLLANGKCKMSAIGTVMRKLLVLMRAILISGQPYDRQWKTPGKQLNEEANL